MIPVEISASIRSPIAISGDSLLLLDGLLWGILEEYRANGKWDGDPSDSVPIERVDGVYLASKAQITSLVLQDHIQTGSIRQVTDLDNAEQRFTNGTRKGRFSKVATTRGEFKGYLSNYKLLSGSAISWRAVADPDACCALLTNAGSIGALRKNGFGGIADVTWRMIENETKSFPLLDNDGKVTRPIPEGHSLLAAGQTTSGKMATSWSPPFWQKNNDRICHIPEEIA